LDIGRRVRLRLRLRIEPPDGSEGTHLPKSLADWWQA